MPDNIYQAPETAPADLGRTKDQTWHIFVVSGFLGLWSLSGFIGLISIAVLNHTKPELSKIGGLMIPVFFPVFLGVTAYLIFKKNKACAFYSVATLISYGFLLNYIYPDIFDFSREPLLPYILKAMTPAQQLNIGTLVFVPIYCLFMLRQGVFK